MTTTSMRLLARGRDADVFALDDTRVLRRYRDPSHSNTEMEARVMEYLAGRGYPVPQVHDVTGTELVMDRLGGRAQSAAIDSGARSARDSARSTASGPYRRTASGVSRPITVA